MNKNNVIFFIFLILLILPNIVLAASARNTWYGKAFVALGFPERWLEGNNLIWYGIVPFLGIWMNMHLCFDEITHII